MSNNNPNKKYRNIKDIYVPCVNRTIKAGSLFKNDGLGIQFVDEEGWSHWAHEAALSNKEWFEEVVEERIKVNIGWKERIRDDYYWICFGLSADIPEQKMEQIRAKIEEIINTDTNIGCNTGKMSMSDMYQLGYKDGVKYSNSDKKYSQSELDAAISDAFCSARLTNGKHIGMKYNGLKDYLNTLNK